MKKLIFTSAIVAAFSFASAQETKTSTEMKQEPVKKKTATSPKTTSKKETTTSGTTSEGLNTTKSEKTSASSTEAMPASTNNGTESKKTRMAINEKGLPGEKKSTKSTSATTPK